MPFDLDEVADKLKRHIDQQAAASMPDTLRMTVADNSARAANGWVLCNLEGKTVRCIVPGHLAAEVGEILLAYPPNDPTRSYTAIGSLNAGDGTISYVPRLVEQGTFAGIHVHDNSVAQTIPTGATYTKLTPWSGNDGSRNCTPDAANDKITITHTGHYLVNGSFSFDSGTANVEFRVAVFLDGDEIDPIHWVRKVGNANDIGAASLSGILDVTGAGLDMDVRVRHDNGGNVDMTIVYGNLSAVYVGET